MLEPWMEIKAAESDADGFIEIVNRLTAITIYQWQVDEIMYINIKNWFDHKWLNYSGNSVVRFAFGDLEEFDDRSDTALQENWNQNITVPPFNPKRIISEQYFRKQPTGNRQFEKHVHKYQMGSDNFQNRISRRTQNGLYVWYSSNSKVNNQGSLMMYRIDEQNVSTWYASIVKKASWEISQTKGIGRNELIAMLQ